MEFFDWLMIPQYFMQYVFGGVTLEQIYIFMGVAGALYLVCLVFGGVGLWIMGSRQGIKYAWIGFFPFANTYLAGKIAGESALFGKRMKRAGLYAMLVEILYVALEILSLVISVILSNPAYYETRSAGGSVTRQMVLGNIPAQYRWMVSGLTWVPAVAMIVFLALVVFLCVVYNALFRKYYARSPFLMTFLSVVFPVRGIVLYAVCKNDPVDYNEYLRERVATILRQNTPQAGEGNEAGSPFAEYPEAHAAHGEPSPFSEFDAPSRPQDAPEEAGHPDGGESGGGSDASDGE